MATQNQTKHLPESILTEILARLPLRSISRFKSVCKAWKSTLKSLYFRRLFLSHHQNTCSSWSLIFKGRELLNFHGSCKTWGLPKSLASYNPCLNTDNIKLSFSNGLVLIEGKDKDFFFVGNPILQQWFQIPAHGSRFGFVTRVDENGVVLDFKVVRSVGRLMDLRVPAYLDLLIYSSETGRWTSKKICLHRYLIGVCPLMNLNGTLYLCSPISWGPRDDGEIIALDFYGESEELRAIPLPDYDSSNLSDPSKPGYMSKWDSPRALTTSRGYVMFIKTFVDQTGDNVLLKVWRLNNDDSWQLLSEILVSFDASDYAPVAMHPFDGNILSTCGVERSVIWYHVTCGHKTTKYLETNQHNIMIMIMIIKIVLLTSLHVRSI